ncbi:MAG: SEL1-like repeat protein [Alphaproteobacteria bacterium]|nr:SEL1-like repeat protein [Alphaproteobacteria bacterium]MCW5741962.1 SEL1-like repeat protein [Alphaproteobacteria bacterium]
MTEDSTNATPTTEKPDADAKAEVAPALATGKRDALSDSARRQSVSGIAVGVLIACLAIGGGWWWWQERDRAKAADAPKLAAAAPAKPDPAPKADAAAKPVEAPPTPKPDEAAVAPKPADDPPPATPADAAAAAKPPDSAEPPKPADTAAPKPPDAPPVTADAPKPAATPPVVESQNDALRRLADAGDVDAMEELGRRYIQGAGVAPDAAEGAKWMLRAAEKGSPRAMFNAGVMHERGFEVPKDTKKAVEWYRKAVAAGVPMAQHNLALLMRDGNGTRADPVGAFEMMRAAARAGVPNSMLALAIMHELGQGTRRDNVAAIVWYAMAAQFAKFAEGEKSETYVSAAAKQADLSKRLPATDLRRAQAIGESEYRTIVDTMRLAARGSPPSSGPATPPGSAAPDLPAGKTVKPIDAKEQLIEIQKMLFALKFYNGPPDGIIGPGTTAAIKEFQKTAGLPVNGEVSQDLFDLLRDMVKSTGAK